MSLAAWRSLAIVLATTGVAVWVGVVHLSPWVLLAWPASWVIAIVMWLLARSESPPACRVCGCTDHDCTRCVAVTGAPCWWIEDDLCSRCAT